MGQYKCKIQNQTPINEDITLMSLEAEEIALESYSGQFVHVKVCQGIDPLLRRPLSIHRVDRQEGTVELLYRVVGRGTDMMRRTEKGHVYDLMGPLGKGFRLDKPFSHALVIAGGMGSAPIFFLIDELIALEKRVTLLWGVREASEIFRVTGLKDRGVEVELATEDGTLGHKGLVTDLLKRFLAERGEDPDMEGFVCGPRAMLKLVQSMADATSFDWQVSMEERMACGVGVCLGCGVRMRQGGYRMVCSDGPVFDLKEVLLDG